MTWYANGWTWFYVYVAAPDNYTRGYFQLDIYYGELARGSFSLKYR